MKIFCVFIAIFAVAAAASENDGLLTTALKFVKDCGDKSMVLCMKVRNNNNKSEWHKWILYSGFYGLPNSDFNQLD